MHCSDLQEEDKASFDETEKVVRICGDISRVDKCMGFSPNSQVTCGIEWFW
jgi:hypothetical protein